VRDRLDAVQAAKRSKGCDVVPDVGGVKDILSLADRHSRRVVLRTYYPVRRGSWLAAFAKSRWKICTTSASFSLLTHVVFTTSDTAKKP